MKDSIHGSFNAKKKNENTEAWVRIVELIMKKA